ncbi:hypothetical protein NM208_g2850 [Fusarium decemcellulare]|uniref:Uncharacterized protein n=1 Tax=Fusarium decemcellulare TaxID=57161 RepID=A0ACC1SRA6_9HYPO|nr:hypothetical protein NM208_g2850 [Fusarium decemcellulare]
MAKFYDFVPSDSHGSQYPLAHLKGKIVLVVNTASKCGFTPQLEGLERLYREIKSEHSDFEIIGFPSNQFATDPGTNTEIQLFCHTKYDVTFPVLGKIDVNGSNANPLWEWMKQSKPGICGLKLVKWNFEKFLIGRDGLVKERWASTTKPEAIKAAIEEELKKV